MTDADTYPLTMVPTLKQAMACGLLKHGHQVLSIAGFPNYPSGKIYPGYRQLFYYAVGMMSNHKQEKTDV
ncbi:hypothetical protein M1N00_00595 [Thermodesulfovibrionales bacterium]|nr:hypothetical protein [Thermodesulfovibrionales bacterium]